MAEIQQPKGKEKPKSSPREAKEQTEATPEPSEGNGSVKRRRGAHNGP